MNKTKDFIQYATAVVMLASGVVLTFLCFFLNGHDVTDGVLWYVAQCIVYAGSIFGVSIYIKSKFEEITHKGITDSFSPTSVVSTVRRTFPE